MYKCDKAMFPFFNLVSKRAIILLRIFVVLVARLCPTLLQSQGL